MIILNWVSVVLILAVGMVCLSKNKTWGRSMHEYYIQESRKHWYGKFFPWEKSWAIVIFRAMFIGIGVILIIAAYPLVFGPFHIEFNNSNLY
jgi:hypothetical protein